ncbi:MAG: hypothetical protein GY723_22475 [bacterium]|nr:hypothetical protein [bacterium]MCP5070777.1 hypothetical protein [bacterium]
MPEKSKILTPALLEHLEARFRLDWRGIHGVAHWARVRWNGLRIAEQTGADTRIVELFAFLHDSQRENDSWDQEHGLRAAEVARELNGRFFELGDQDLDLLVFACQEHTFGGTKAHPTVQTCWDADRLDLGRVGKRPDPARLCTEAARDRVLLRKAWVRSVQYRGW